MRSRASKHRFEAWIHGPDPPSASPCSLGQACSLSVSPLPPLCNGGNGDNNGCGEDYINRSTSELCKNSLPSSSYMGSRHPSPLLPPILRFSFPGSSLSCQACPGPPGSEGELSSGSLSGHAVGGAQALLGVNGGRGRCGTLELALACCAFPAMPTGPVTS